MATPGSMIALVYEEESGPAKRCGKFTLGSLSGFFSVRSQRCERQPESGGMAMTRFAILIIVAVLCYTGYVHWFRPSPGEPARETSTATPPVVMAGPSPSPSAALIQPAVPPSPTSAPQTVAPAGVYFLTQRVSITTESGVLGIVPGTKVTLVKDSGGTLTVTEGQHQFDVLSNQLTNDIGLASKLAAADLARQAKAVEATSSQVQANNRRLQEQAQTQASEQQRTQMQPRAIATPTATPPLGSSLDKKAFDKTRDHTQIDSFGRVYWVDIYGRRHYR